MSKKDLAASLFPAAMLCLIALGCRPLFSGSVPSIPPGVASVLPTVDAVKLYYIAGLGLMVAGAIIFVLGGRATGGGLVGAGAGIAWFGQNLALRPWLSLAALLLTGGIAAALAFDRWRKERVLGVIAKNVENTEGGKQVKASIDTEGDKTVSLVRKVLTPIKRRLADTREI